MTDSAKAVAPPSLLAKVGAVLGSYTLCMACLFALFWITLFGTLYQVEESLLASQIKYFESWGVIHELGTFLGVDWKVPLPGGYLIMVVLSINLLIGGVMRVWNRGTRVIGVLIAHLGILLLCVGAWVRLHYAVDGQVQLFEPLPAAQAAGDDGSVDDPATQAQVYLHDHNWELAVIARQPDGSGKEYTFPDPLFADAQPAAEGKNSRVVTLRATTLPLTLEVSHFMRNCVPREAAGTEARSAPALEGLVLAPAVDDPKFRKFPGIYLEIPELEGATKKSIVWGRSVAPWVVRAAGREYLISLRRQRLEMPWNIRLVDFVKEDHPGTGLARRFSSDVVITDAAGSDRDVHISMNNPFRDDGFVVYQSGWGPQEGPVDRYYTVLTVSKNPADLIPWIGVSIIALGLAIHFIMKLARFIRREAARAQRAGATS